MKKKEPLFSVKYQKNEEEYKNALKATGEMSALYNFFVFFLGAFIVSHLLLIFHLEMFWLYAIVLLFLFVKLTTKQVADKKIDKVVNKLKMEKGEVEFYEEYGIVTCDNYKKRFSYHKIERIIETNTMFYICFHTYQNMLFIDKKELEEKDCQFIKKLQSEKEQKKETKEKMPFCSNRIAILLSIILMLASVILAFCAKDIQEFLSKKENLRALYWLIIVVPIIAHLFSSKIRKQLFRLSNIINVVAAICEVVIILIGFIGLSDLSTISNTNDKSKLTEYEKVFLISFPASSGVHQIDASFYGKGDMTETTMIEVIYDTSAEVKDFEKSLTKENKWISSSEIPKELEVFTSYPMNEVCKDCYYFVYNNTTKEENTFPKEDGKYHIYVAIYDLSKKKLRINDFDYELKR